MELRINGIKAELGDSVPAITKKSVDINNPSLRFIDYTNKFQLPDTQINRELLESPQQIGSNNRSFNKLFDCTLNDVFKIFEGQGFLEDTQKDVFNFQLVDKAKNLFNQLNIKLKSISWDDKDTQLTEAQINTLDSLDIDNCWFWGKACYHESGLQINTDQTTGSARTKYSRPAFNVNGLLNRAVALAGYTLTAPAKSLAISSNHEKFYFTSYEKNLNTTYNVLGSLALSGLDTNTFEHADLTTASTSINIGALKTIFRVRGVASSTAQIYMVIKAVDDVDSSKISESRFLLPQSEGNIDFVSSEFQSDNGMTVDIRFEGTGDAIFTNTLLYTIHDENSADLSTNPWLNYKIKAYDNLPDLNYLDLYRLICIVYNNYHIVDNFNKTISFGSLANLKKLNAVDWSDKHIINSEFTAGSISGLAQTNKLRYENDETVNRELGESSFSTDNEALPVEGDYFVLDFSASNEVEINSNNIAHVYIYNDTGRIPDQVINTRLFEIDSDLLTFNPITWQNIKTNYYSDWFNSLHSIRLINSQFNLSKLDFLEWSEGQLVYIDYYKSTFIVLEIVNFMPGTPTTVKILRYGR